MQTTQVVLPDIEVREEVLTAESQPIVEKEIPIVKQETKVKIVDPCDTSGVRVKEYQEKNLWRVEEAFSVKSAPHDNCNTATTLDVGRALLSYGEAGNLS